MDVKKRKPKSAADLKAELAKLREKIKAIESKAYEGELVESINATNVVQQFKALCEKHKDVAAVNILQAIGKAAGIPRVVVSQSTPVKRASKKTTKK